MESRPAANSHLIFLPKVTAGSIKLCTVCSKYKQIYFKLRINHVIFISLFLLILINYNITVRTKPTLATNNLFLTKENWFPTLTATTYLKSQISGEQACIEYYTIYRFNLTDRHVTHLCHKLDLPLILSPYEGEILTVLSFLVLRCNIIFFSQLCFSHQ